MPGEALSALFEKVGFQKVKLAGYTGMKSSPYTEGALILAEKPGLSQSLEASAPTLEPPLARPEPLAPAESGGS